MFGEDLVAKVGAGFEGELLGEDEGVVAVVEDGVYLEGKRVSEEARRKGKNEGEVIKGTQ